jgi:hypothetical protein
MAAILPSKSMNRSALGPAARGPLVMLHAYGLAYMRLWYHLTLVSTKFPPEAMPLSADLVSCIPKHTRSIRFEVHARAGLTRGLREAKTGTD